MPSFFDKVRTFTLLAYKKTQREVRNRFFLPSETFRQDAGKAHGSIKGYLAWRREQKLQYIEAVIGREEVIRALMPSASARAIADADRVLTHTFDLLGSGDFTPVDPDRPVRDNGYRPIDWYLDPVRGLRFPVKVPHKEWKLYEMRPANADVKYPWELGRSQHFMPLMQAWRLTRDVKYAHEIIDQIADFMEANPVGMGVNWTCTMDVAIRAGNWALALAGTLDCAEISESDRIDAYAALFDHGKFIFENLENTYEVTSNHFLSNVIGLHFIAGEFPHLPQAKGWDEFCRKALEREIVVQIHDEGADFESAIPYHRLVAELFLASARLAQWQGRPLSDTFHERLGTMIALLVGVQRPDGLMPVIGDADDGRYHIMTDYCRWNRQDARHIYAPAALTLNRPGWLALAGEDGRWEATWWGFDPETVTTGTDAAPESRILYPNVGIAVTRTGGEYLAITNGVVGTNGFGNHKHNELLGFEYHTRSVPFLIDAGSHVYTSDFDSRNRFRSTAIHNTVMIDGEEQNETRPEWIFRLFESASPEHVTFEEAGGVVTYTGRHTGYQRIPAKATHERTFSYQRSTGILTLTDTLTGEGEADLLWHFHGAPGVTMTAAPGLIRLDHRGVTVSITLPEGLEAVVSPSLASPSYGVAVACQAADIRARLPLDGRPLVFTITPEGTA